MRVKPTDPAVKVPYPGTLEMLPDEGAEVPDNQYWRRRLADGDVVLTAEVPPPPTPTPRGRAA